MNWLKKKMIGRYGVDQLSNVLIVLSFILLVVSIIADIKVINSIAMGILLVSYIRIFSRNINKRYQENLKFLNWWNPIKFKWLGFANRTKQFKTHRFYKCPQCNQELRVPKGKGKINVSCPKCHNKFEKRT